MTTTPLSSEVNVTGVYNSLAKATGLVPQKAQIPLSLAIHQSLSARVPFVAEAPTGTGKTIAYLAGALADGEANPVPVVISTATKLLQQQLVSNDLPRFFAAGLLKPENVAIAKGRSNYLCLQNAEELLDALAEAEANPELFLDEKLGKADRMEMQTALASYQHDGWDGDFDQYTGLMSAETKQAIAVSVDTCNRKKCPHFKECAYYKAKAKVAGARVVVTNHDLLLKDLLLSHEGIEPTLSVANYNLIVDEAHHLPAKAIRAGATEARLTLLALSLPKLTGMQRLLSTSPELVSLLARSSVTVKDLERGPVLTPVRDLLEQLETFEVDQESKVWRFKSGALPPGLTPFLEALEQPLSALVLTLTRALRALVETETIPEAAKSRAFELQRRLLDVKSVAEAAGKCVKAFLSKTSCAKWFVNDESSLSLHCVPLEGADVLKPLLWQSDRVSSVAMLSATLRDLDGFTRFLTSSGAPHKTRTLAIPHTFPYEKSLLEIVGMQATPKAAERREYLRELKLRLPQKIDPAQGTLVLFQSWAVLRDMAPALVDKYGKEFVKVQGSMAAPLLIAAHKRDIDEGRGSMLLGVASLSEGLDLPGRYCTHVAITGLPFAAPNDPVEQELSEILGNRYFSERSLPDAVLRLVQMVGRLIRRSTDEGRVSVFDRRLASTSYGRAMLKRLPPFKVQVEPLS